MKKNYCKVMLLSLALSASVCAYAGAPVVTLGAPAGTEAVAKAQAKAGGVVINGTGQTGTFTVNAENLTDKITLTATPGLEVFPETLPASASNVPVQVTLLSTLPETNGYVYLRSGDFRGYVQVTGYGSPLEQKDLSANPVFNGSEKTFTHAAADGFTAGKNGYTVEFRVKSKSRQAAFDAFAVTTEGAAFKAYVDPTGIGLYNAGSQVNIENPLTAEDGGKKVFYNVDGKYHTYRYAVTSDKRVFVYRDGQQVATLRAADYANQSTWGVENGEISENLLKNGNFEGEWNTRTTDSLTNRVEGWILDPIDKYNCTYEVINKEINNELDYNNHVMKLQRYNWNDGWGAGTVSQIVDVAPNSTYSLSFLAMGGMDEKSGTNMSSVKIQEVQDNERGTSVTITNNDAMKEYGLNYTTSADCRQIKVILHNERFLNGGGWGSSPQPFLVDEMALTGISRVLDQKTGFNATATDVEYFTYDPTGAYAPVTPVLEAEESNVTIQGTGNNKTVKVKIANLISADKVKVSATAGFSVYPEVLDASKDGQIIITLNSTLPETNGKVILRSGDTRSYIYLTGYADDLEVKDIKENPAFNGSEKTFEATAADGFTAGKDGYTVEFRIKTKSRQAAFDAYAVTKEGAAFKTFVEPNALGLYNAGTQVNLENPLTAEDGGQKVFYNIDGKYHTYRYAVTSDGRVNIYRDGLLVANQRTADFANQATWAIENGEVVENLLKNGNFEGEWNTRADELVNRVEGWRLDPIDRYNCTYSVINNEINNDLDHNNHVMKLQRYNWNDGWGAGTVSQIVDVAPNSTYSLSFLAMGGMDEKSGTNMSSVKIQEVQDNERGTSVTITNNDAMKEYGLNYTTSADCRQIKVILHNERFLNGGGWGSSPQPFLVDEMALTGTSRVLDQKTGFTATTTDVEYFAFDATGAYAPMAPGFGDDVNTGVEDVEVNAAYARATADGVVLYNIPDGAAVSVYDSLGKLVASDSEYLSGSTIALPGRGLYICVVAGEGDSQTVKVLY